MGAASSTPHRFMTIHPFPRILKGLVALDNVCFAPSLNAKMPITPRREYSSGSENHFGATMPSIHPSVLLTGPSKPSIYLYRLRQSYHECNTKRVALLQRDGVNDLLPISVLICKFADCKQTYSWPIKYIRAHWIFPTTDSCSSPHDMYSSRIHIK